MVLLVEADRVLDRVRLALFGRQHRVEVVDDAGTVAPVLQRVRHATEPPLAGVERVLPPVHRARVPVGHDHLAHRRPIEHGPDDARCRCRPVSGVGIVVCDGVQHQALVGIEADTERPPLPAHEVPVDVEARAVGLRDLDRLQVVAHRSDIGREVRTPFRRHRDHAEVDHLEHLTGTLVEEGDHVLDRARVPVVGLRLALIGDAAADAAAFLVLDAERARGPRVDLHEVEVVDAPPPHRRLPLGVLLHRHDRLERLAEQQRRPHAVAHGPRADLTGGDRHDDLDHLEASRLRA